MCERQASIKKYPDEAINNDLVVVNHESICRNVFESIQRVLKIVRSDFDP